MKTSIIPANHILDVSYIYLYFVYTTPLPRKTQVFVFYFCPPLNLLFFFYLTLFFFFNKTSSGIFPWCILLQKYCQSVIFIQLKIFHKHAETTLGFCITHDKWQVSALPGATSRLWCWPLSLCIVMCLPTITTVVYWCYLQVYYRTQYVHSNMDMYVWQ